MVTLHLKLVRPSSIPTTKVNPQVASKQNKIRKPSPLLRGEGSMAWRGLTEATWHSGGVVGTAR